MTDKINGADISLYQEYPWKKIDWRAFKDDPMNFRFIWIKCQEGSLDPTMAGSYDMDLVKAQIAGAQSVGFEAINLYHYYWYQYQSTSGGWVIVDAYAQAKAFYDTWKFTGLKILHPMTDIEDPLISQFLQWTDTDGANKAIAFASKLNRHLRDYHQAVTDFFGVRPDIYCVGADTKILTRDLKWVNARNLEVGDSLISFEDLPSNDGKHGRTLLNGHVTHNDVIKLPAYKIKLVTGEELISTPEHRWLLRTGGNKLKWVRTDEISMHINHGNRKVNVLSLPRFVSKHDLIDTYDMGFLSAAFDSEGCVLFPNKQGIKLCFAQRANPLLDRVIEILDKNNYKYNLSISKYSGCTNIQLQGGRDEVLRFLQEARPPRLLSKWLDAHIENMRLKSIEEVEIESISDPELLDIARISTDVGTYIAEGFGAHNTGGWWLNKFVPLLIQNGRGNEIAWMNSYKFVLADYAGGLDIPNYIPVENVIAWQRTSSPVPPVNGIPTGRVVPGDALDIDQWMRSEAEFLAWSQGASVPMTAGIHDVNVPMAKRAWVMEIRTDQKFNIPYSELGVDALILPMVHMPWNGSHQTVNVESTFIDRYNTIKGVPVLGKIVIDAGIVTTEQHSEPELDGHTIWQNMWVPKILDAWHIGPWTPATLKPENFRPLKALIFEQVSEVDHRTPASPIEDFWQAEAFTYVTDKIRTLMAAGAIPTVPIILKTTCDWLKKYPNNFGTMLSSRNSWLYLALSDPQLQSTSVFPDLWSIYKFAPTDAYKHSYVPDKYADRVVLLEFSAGKQRMTFASGTAYLSQAFTDAPRWTKWLGTGVLPPVDPIDPTDSEKLAKLWAAHPELH